MNRLKTLNAAPLALCFLDMDGVLADFAGGVCRAHNRPHPWTEPLSYGVFDMEKLWGISAEEFWKPTLFDGFWLGLEKTPEADELVTMALGLFGCENIAILTSPARDARCVPEKRAWIERHYPFLADNMIFGSAKRFLSAANRVLFDDRDTNISGWQVMGGTGVVVPRLWNSLYGGAHDAINVIAEQVKRQRGVKTLDKFARTL